MRRERPHEYTQRGAVMNPPSVGPLWTGEAGNRNMPIASASARPVDAPHVELFTR